MAIAITNQQLKKQIEALVKPNALKHPIKEEYWIDGEIEVSQYVESFSYCEPCALKRIKTLEKEYPGKEFYLSYGDEESDLDRFCATCEIMLAVIYTDYAIEDTLNHFEENPFNLQSTEHCWILQNIIDSLDPTWPFECEDSERLIALSNKILEESKMKAKSQNVT